MSSQVARGVVLRGATHASDAERARLRRASGVTAPLRNDRAVEAVRRHLSTRQADTVQGLVDAAVEEVAERGYDGLTVRNVARRAGVAPATAYTYFSGKDHLLAEVFARRVRALPPVRVDRRRSAADRVGDVTRDIAMVVADEPELAAAVTTALLAHDPDVKRLRDATGAVFTERLHAALGDDADETLVRSLILALTGALLIAGMGNVDYAELPDQMAETAALMTRSGRRSR